MLSSWRGDTSAGDTAIALVVLFITCLVFRLIETGAREKFWRIGDSDYATNGPQRLLESDFARHLLTAAETAPYREMGFQLIIAAVVYFPGPTQRFGAKMPADDGESAATLIQAVAFLFVFCLANVVFHGWLHPLVSRLCTRAGARVEATKAAAPADA